MTNNSKPIIRLRNVRKTWPMGDDRVTALDGVDLSVHPGRSLAITGPSGSGKSTLLHVLGFLTPVDEGTVEWNGASNIDVAGRRAGGPRRSIGFVFQDAKLIPGLSVLDNVCMPLTHRDIWPARQKVIAREILEQVGLENRAHHPPNRLSGGELMRAALARALVLHPRVLLADEPTGTLDSGTGEMITELLLETVTPERALVIVTHYMPLARRTDRVVHLRDGRIDTDNE